MVFLSNFRAQSDALRNLIAKKGALSLAEALRSNEVLESLDLRPDRPSKGGFCGIS